MKRLALWLSILFLPLAAHAQLGPVTNFCVQGGVPALTSGLQSTNRLQGVIPSCTVTVYLTGTTTKATIYSDALSTPLANPFTATGMGAPGQWLFYAASSSLYDVVLSGGIAPNTYPSPVTLTGIGSGAGAGAACGSAPFGVCSNNSAGTATTSNSNVTINPNGTLAVGTTVGIGISSLAALQAQVTACGFNTCSIFISENIAVTANYTIPANVSLTFAGGQLQPATGVTLTISGPINAPAVQIFGGAGSIAGLVIARPEWLGTATIAQTVATLSSAGGTVLLSNATYRSGYEGGAATLSIPNITILGTQRPSYNSGFTALVNGSIIQGTFNAVAGANSLVIKNVGFDMGSAFVNASLGGVPSDSFSIDVPGQAVGIPAVTGVVIDNVNCLNFSSTALFHCMLVENVDGASIHNTQSVYGVHGAVLKGTNSTWDGHYGRGESYDVMILKGDNYANEANLTVSNIRGNYLNTVGDTGGLVLQAGLGWSLSTVTLTNVAMSGTSSIIDFTTSLDSGNINTVSISNLSGNAITGACIQGNGLLSLPFSNITISNVTCNGAGQAINIAGNLDNSSITGFSGNSLTLGAILSGAKITLSDFNLWGIGSGAALVSNCAGCTAFVSNLQTDDATRIAVSGGASITEIINANGGIAATSVTDSALTPGNCVQASTGGLLTTTGSACGSGGSGPTLQTNSVNNTSQSTLNFETSTTNAAGLTVTPSNPSGGIELMEVTGIVTAAHGGSGVANTATHTLGTSNQNWATLGTGIVKNTTTTGAISDAASSDVIGLWTGTCSSSTFLRGDGACAAGSVTGTGTTGYIPAWTSSTAVGNSHLDDGITTGGTITSSEPLAVGGSGSQVGFTNAGLLTWGTDTGLTRDSAGVIDVGNGTAGNKSGSMNMANLTVTGTCTGCGSSTAFSAITSGANSTAAMTINPGASILDGGGEIDANVLSGETVSTNPGGFAGYVLTTTPSYTANWQKPVFGSLTTTGTSGAATLSGGVLNVPNYSFTALTGNITLTTATSDAITITGVTTSSKCSFSATNSTAAGITSTLAGYYAVTANTFTLNHAATIAAGATYGVLCSLN